MFSRRIEPFGTGSYKHASALAMRRAAANWPLISSISSVVVLTHPTPHVNRELKCLALYSKFNIQLSIVKDGSFNLV